MTRPLIAVHGFMYDINDPTQDASTLYAEWQAGLDREVTPFHYFSKPSIWQAARLGFANPYQCAWSLAEHAGSKRLAEALAALETPADIICHSLGSLVVLKALEQGAPARRVLLLGGAAYSSLAAKVSHLRPEVEFYNVWSSADWVLSRLGAYFGPKHGETCLGEGAASLGINWWDFERHGSNHWEYYRKAENFHLYRSILNPNVAK